MTPAAICTGTTIEGLRVPPFEVAKGEIAALIWPEQGEQRALKELRRRIESGAVIVPGPAASGLAFADPYPPWCWSWLHLGWEPRATLGQEQIDAYLEWRGYAPTTKLRTLSGDDRLLWGLQLAFEAADVVLFQATGTSPYVISREVSRWLEKGKAAIEFSKVKLSRNSIDRDAHPSAKRILVKAPPGCPAYPPRQEVVNVLARLVAGEITRADAVRWADEVGDRPVRLVTDRTAWHMLNLLRGAALADHEGRPLHTANVLEDWLRRSDD